MDLAKGTRLGPYEIISPLGAGGMGQVYLAQDIRLRRKVALKILPSELTGNADRLLRFEHEAQAASALNHPNIITIYDIGQADASHFIATEYVEGETLRQHMRRPQMSVIEVLHIAVQAADALSEAHQAGIIHRDIKPENLILKKNGLLKLLDFGLAKLTERQAPSTDSSAPTVAKVDTAPGLLLGTLAYMSPEQARGKDVDARTDVFSFGVLLYEMMTSHAPFAGETTSDIIAAILKSDPEPISSYSPEAPAELQRIITKALRKDREERYQTMKDMLIDLRELRDELALEVKLDRSIRPANNSTAENQQTLSAEGGITKEAAVQTSAARAQTTSSAEYLVRQIQQHKRAAVVALFILLAAATSAGFLLFSKRTAGTKPIESIAVMPFQNESGNPDAEYLSDGMTETLISSLSQLPNLNVKARSSVFRYKGKEFDLQKVAQELKVQAILTGRVMQRGEQLTLSLELVDTQTENAIWSEQYNRKQTDLISLQSEIALDVSQKLRTKLSGGEEQKLTKKYTENPEAYKLYLQGSFYTNRRLGKDLQKAVENFQQAIAIDPNYALAYAGLANAYLFLNLYGDTPANEALPKARETVLKALALDNTLAEAHGTLALILLFQDRDVVGSGREMKLALDLNPNYAEGHRRRGIGLMFRGRFEEALAAFRRALEIDPLSSVINMTYGTCLLYAGRYDESEAQLKQTLSLDANFWLTNYNLYNLYRLKADHAAAIEALAKSQELRGEPDAAKLIRESFAKGGWQGFLRNVSAERTRAKLSPYVLATFEAELGEKDKAFVLLNESQEKRDQFFSFVRIDPLMNPLRSDPRFQELLKKVGPQQ